MWKTKSLLWEETATNYQKQLDLATATINSQQDLQNKKEAILEAEIKKANKNGIKKGVVVTSVAAIIVCLLIK